MSAGDRERHDDALREMVTSLRGSGEGIAARYAAASLSPATRLAYLSDLRLYLGQGHTWPPSLDDLCEWIALQADDGLSRSTIRRRLHALRTICEITDTDWPAETRRARRALNGCVREHTDAKRQKRARPIRLVDLVAMVSTCGADELGIRDRALLLVGWCTAVRRSTLVGIDWEHLELRDEGYALTVPHSKTDQEGRGVVIPIPRGNSEGTCPVTALERLREFQSPADAGPVLRAQGRSRVRVSRLSARQCARIIQTRARLAGVGDGVSGHSLRSGMATEAASRGVPSYRIRAITGHSSDAGLTPYLRDGELFNDPVALQLGI